MDKGKSVPETEYKDLYIIQLKLISLFKDEQEAGASGNNTKASGTDIDLDDWLFCFLIYYVCQQELFTDYTSGVAS